MIRKPARAPFDPPAPFEAVNSNNRRYVIENMVDADPVAARGARS